MQSYEEYEKDIKEQAQQDEQQRLETKARLVKQATIAFLKDLAVSDSDTFFAIVQEIINNDNISVEEKDLLMKMTVLATFYPILAQTLPFILTQLPK
jgi:hypothetical protein